MVAKKHLHIKVYGIVQGVGFRPFVSRIAAADNIEGTVCNKGSYVDIYASGTKADVDKFLSDLEELAPPRSVILRIKTWELSEEPEYNGEFAIIESAKEQGLVFVSPDIATCPDCKRELYESGNRRYLHPFINCTACGPRLTILDSMPYDRVRTSMGEFPMCDDCYEEYTNPVDRRYHAQPVCCNECGPELYIVGSEIRGEEALLLARKTVREGGIVAIKGIGGFHLCCDARNEEAVDRLRELKKRPYKPFAVMMRDMETVKAECEVLPGQEEILEGPQKPIILLQSKGTLPESIAPGNPNVGVMLPYAPVQMLMFDYPEDPDGNDMTDCFVMTSGNPKGAPICMNDEEANKYLSSMCDLILSNDRKIRLRADDTVMSFYKGKPYMIRRSRGYAPLPVIMTKDIEKPVLGIGGELKNTFCLAKGDMLYPSAYIGDMADLRSTKALRAAVDRMMTLLEIRPEVLSCDLHPKYNTSEIGRLIADELGIPRIEVQHHYAHIASCMAENEVEDRVIGISFDGTGYGEDGTIWGGEIMLADMQGYERVGSVEQFTHAGGDLASREGFRIAATILMDDPELLEKLDIIDDKTLASIRFMVANGVNVIGTTSAGRLFDAVSAILGIKKVNTFEGEASMALQFAAERAYEELRAQGDCAEQGCVRDVEQGCREHQPEGSEHTEQERREHQPQGSEPAEQGCRDGQKPDAALPVFEGNLITVTDGFITMNTTRLVHEIARLRAEGGDSDQLALTFHVALADMVVEACKYLREVNHIDKVALSGGVFQNLLLLKLVDDKLEELGFQVIRHSMIPPNDGGIALGQARIAAAREL